MRNSDGRHPQSPGETRDILFRKITGQIPFNDIRGLPAPAAREAADREPFSGQPDPGYVSVLFGGAGGWQPR